MKIAGRKNDGAWYRTNKKLQTVGPSAAGVLKTLLVGDTTIAAMHAVILNLANEGGYVEVPDEIADLDAWVTTLVETGIPRQAWLGVLTWDRYTKDGDVYTPEHAATWRAGAAQLRKLVTRFFLTRRQINDLGQIGTAQEGNPGGIADAQKD